MSLKRRQLKFTLLKFDIFLRSLIFVRCCVAPLRKKGVEQCSFARVQYRYIHSNLGIRCQKSWVRSWEGRCGEVARTSSGRRDSRGSSWFESTWTAAKLRPRLVGVARRGCRTMRRAACSSWSADDGRRGVLPAIGGWVSGHLAGFAGRPVPVCESAWADSLR